MACPYGMSDHPLFLNLKRDHDKIRSKLKDASTVQSQRNLLDWLWKEVEVSLHRQEEILLYPLLEGKPQLAEGGPYCTLYYDHHLNHPPAKEAQKITGKEVGWEPHQEHFRELQTSLLIPLEEHRSLHAILKHLRESPLPDSSFQMAFEAYRSLLDLHLTKEERCFFRVCQSLLTKAELDTLLAKWNPLQD